MNYSLPPSYYYSSPYSSSYQQQNNIQPLAKTTSKNYFMNEIRKLQNGVYNGEFTGLTAGGVPFMIPNKMRNTVFPSASTTQQQPAPHPTNISHPPPMPGNQQKYSVDLHQDFFKTSYLDLAKQILGTTAILILTWTWFKAMEGIFHDISLYFTGGDRKNVYLIQALLTTGVIVAIHEYMTIKKNKNETSTTRKKNQSTLFNDPLKQEQDLFFDDFVVV